MKQVREEIVQNCASGVCELNRVLLAASLGLVKPDLPDSGAKKVKRKRLEVDLVRSDSDRSSKRRGKKITPPEGEPVFRGDVFVC